VDSGQLHRLGRRLIELSRAATSDTGDQAVTPAEAAIVEDVIKNRGASVTEISQRTGFVQSHVSASVARLRERGLLETSADPADGRRTTVQITRSAGRAIMRRSRRPVEGVIKKAVTDANAARRAVELLDELAELLI
jgi:DNA-binding MarR family transcriptional regulator